MASTSDSLFYLSDYYNTWPWTNAVTSADYDNDGDQDLAAVVSLLDYFFVTFNDGSGVFDPPVLYGTGSRPEDIISADVNDDKEPDLVIVNSNDDAISVFLNDGLGNFTFSANYPTAPYATRGGIGDLDGDGYIDLAISNRSDSVSVLLNNGDGTFAPYVAYPVGEYPVALDVVDIDNDNDSDLVVANYNSENVSVLLNNGDASFQSAVHYNVGDSPIHVTCADFDLDGDIDIMAAAWSTILLRNNGDDTFASFEEIFGFPHTRWIEPADYSEDGYIDLAIVVSVVDNFNAVFLLINDGAGNYTLEGATALADVTYTARNVDLDGDGDQDLALGLYSLIAILSNRAIFLCGDANAEEAVDVGDIVFLINHIFRDGPPPFPIDAGDANCDGSVNVGDAVYLINYVFHNGFEPCCP
jgi:hypothetical protein